MASIGRQANLGGPHVLNGMRRQRREPLCGWMRNRKGRCASVKEKFSLPVPADEVRGAYREDHARPAMRVYGNELARWNANLQDAHPIVFEQQPVMVRCSSQGIERIRPGP